MAILSKSITIPLLIIFCLPVTFFAIFTTAIAFSVLLFRFTLIYIDLAVAVVAHYLLGSSSNLILSDARGVRSRAKSPQPLPTSTYKRRKRRTSSNGSVAAAGMITPIGLMHSRSNSRAILTSPNSCVGLNTSIGPTRDYEGVGGWRLDTPSEEEDGLWTKINSRLELPADHGRRHRRSRTSEEVPTLMSLSRGEMKRGRSAEEGEMVMNTKRGRTPPTTALGGAVAGVGESTFEKGVLMMRDNGNGQRKVSSSRSTGSNGSSKSSGLSMKGR